MSLAGDRRDDADLLDGERHRETARELKPPPVPPTAPSDYAELAEDVLEKNAEDIAFYRAALDEFDRRVRSAG